MSATDDLRDRLTEALFTVRESSVGSRVDAIMPTVREALADAWDEGYADGGHDEHEFRPGRRATNPWREAD